MGPLSIRASLDPSSNSNAAQHYDNSWRLSFHVPGAGRKTVPTSECCAGITVDLLLDPFQSLPPGSSNPLLTFHFLSQLFSHLPTPLGPAPVPAPHTPSGLAEPSGEDTPGTPASRAAVRPWDGMTPIWTRVSPKEAHVGFQGGSCLLVVGRGRRPLVAAEYAAAPPHPLRYRSLESHSEDAETTP